MKQIKKVSLIGALVLIMSAVVLITGCSQANSNKGNTGNNSGNISNNGGNTGNNGGTTSNNGGTTGGNTGNNGGSLAVQPTGKADPTLKGTTWAANTPIIFMQFTNQGNIMEIDEYRQALYQVDGLKISFDLSSFLTMEKNLTVEGYIDWQISTLKKGIAELEEKSKTADEETKKNLKQKIEEYQGYIADYSKPEAKDEVKEFLPDINKAAEALLPYAKFEGMFNAEKTELTIEKFPGRLAKGGAPGEVKLQLRKK